MFQGMLNLVLGWIVSMFGVLRNMSFAGTNLLVFFLASFFLYVLIDRFISR